MKGIHYLKSIKVYYAAIYRKFFETHYVKRCYAFICLRNFDSFLHWSTVICLCNIDFNHICLLTQFNKNCEHFLFKLAEIKHKQTWDVMEEQFHVVMSWFELKRSQNR